MVEKMIIKQVGGYTENEWTNPRTGERKTIKSYGLVLENGNNSFVAEASDDVAVRLSSMAIKPDIPVLASLSFVASKSEKENSVRYYQRVRIDSIILL